MIHFFQHRTSFVDSCKALSHPSSLSLRTNISTNWSLKKRLRKKEERAAGGGGDYPLGLVLGTGKKIGQFAICTSSIIDFVCPQNFADPLFLISPGYCSRPREIEDITYAIFFWGGGVGTSMCIMGDKQEANS